jgi:hypothetical protein
MSAQIPIADRFWSKVDKDGPIPEHRPELGPCWLWTASTDRRGYGRIGYGGTNGGWTSAHRAAWELADGPVPDGLLVLHHCDNPPCVRRTHLFLGTHVDNMADMRAKRRSLAGARHNLAKLDDQQVEEIRRRVAAGERQETVAKAFGTSQSHVSGICSGRFWRRDGDAVAAE